MYVISTTIYSFCVVLIITTQILCRLGNYFIVFGRRRLRHQCVCFSLFRFFYSKTETAALVNGIFVQTVLATDELEEEEEEVNV